MFDIPPSPADNEEVFNCYVKCSQKLQEAAVEMKALEELLEDKYMAITKTDRQCIEDAVTTICSAAWGLKIQGVKIKQAKAKSRIMTACYTTPID
jgi:hypothetical protein